MQLLLYTTQTSPRLQYIFGVLCQAAGITPFEITTDISYFKNASCCKINYSASAVAATECHIVPVSMLFENDIREQTIDFFDWQGNPAFFSSGGDLPFDVLAASFYLVTRYEEYLPHKKDEYGRYAHTNSLAYQQNFLHLPLVNLWARQWVKNLSEKFSQLQTKPPAWCFVPTYDIDMAWSYFGKGGVRNIGGLLRELLSGEMERAAQRVKFLLAFADDPFDVYEWLDELHRKYHLKPIYFFLVAARRGRYDKNLSPRNKAFSMLIQKLSAMYQVGLHPSWQSGDIPSLLSSEKKALDNVIGRPIQDSRQHYIRMHVPHTYRQLIGAGITNDYSMGYGSINGFRASYCLPFNWYDVEAEQCTNLVIHPYCYMEANSIFEQKITEKEALDELLHYLKITNDVHGQLVTIFHNHLLSTEPKQQGWRNMYEQFLAHQPAIDS